MTCYVFCSKINLDNYTRGCPMIDNKKVSVNEKVRGDSA